MNSKKEYIENNLPLIEDMIKQNLPKFEIARVLNVKYDTLNKHLKRLGINYDGNPNRKGIHHIESRKDLEIYFSNKQKISASKLRKNLIRDGYKEEKCERCGLTEWMGGPIPLELHHKNFNHYDNSLENLEILCPCCHKQIHGYNNNSNKKDVPKIEVQKKVTENKEAVKTPKYDINEVINLMKCHRNYTKVGKILGISDNAVRKRLKNNGYPAVLEEFLKYIDNNEK
jgi:DNA-binding protein Fis